MIKASKGRVSIQGSEITVRADFMVIAHTLIHEAGMQKEELLHLAGMAAMSESEMEKELERMERMFAHE